MIRNPVMSFLYGSWVPVVGFVLDSPNTVSAAAPLSPIYQVGRPLEDLKHRPACPMSLHLRVGLRHS